MMKLIKKVSKKIMILLMAVMMGVAPEVTIAGEQANKLEVLNAKVNESEVRLQDDFYSYINKEWLENTNLNDGRPFKMAITELDERCQSRIQSIFNEIRSNEKKYTENDTEKKMINLYNNYLDKAERNKQGIAPVKSYLEQIKRIDSLEELNDLLDDMTMGNIAGMYSIYTDVDIKDTTKKCLCLSTGNLLLGEADCYKIETEGTKLIEQATTTYLKELLVLTGYSKEEAGKKIKKAYDFEKLFVGNMIGSEEQASIDNLFEYMYNEFTLSELDKKVPNLKMGNRIKKISSKTDKIIVTEPKWLEALNKAYTQDNLESIKNYLEIQFVRYAADYLADEFTEASNAYNMALTGTTGQLQDKEAAMALVNNIFSEVLGKLYVDKYFSESVKKDVEGLVNEVVEVYKEKIKALDWMEESTKKNALKKLDTINVKVGYPDKWKDYSKLEIKSYAEGGSLLENMIAYDRWNNENEITLLEQPYVKGNFRKSPQTVNAMYETDNTVIILAGILQAPFYDPDRSREANLGGIGVLIGHEISHAFDTNGANLDENGMISEWWTEKDYENFQKKADQVVGFYSGLTTKSGKEINGENSVNENIADIGGMSCALEMMKHIENANYKEFFETWACCWRAKMTDKYETYFLQTQPYSTNEIRVNATVSQFQEFYDTYSIKEDDKMYVKPENRLKIF